MHDYDMYGHTPGCPECWDQRERTAARDRAYMADKQTLPVDAVIEVSVFITSNRTPYSIEKSQTFKVNANERFDPQTAMHAAFKLGYDALDDFKKESKERDFQERATAES